ncbi:MAG: hypothetical protein A3K19_31035 [Lentisphaerae bacterium RIFOXYB12_FULL_65_16]|nr:MAG: hypothetical protein A3K18_26800 [Lentisphaerae bacterium RIFOXYA12_64_32]OGV88875.1 MAG: hypothetical protein A3K19_31035 [Lentisphaerae bacterium RIFOXYB12_FULL_65_16]
MSSSSIMTVGMTGMLAQGNSMAVIGNNIANNRTVGFKRGSMNFQESLYMQTAGANAAGLMAQQGTGVGVAGVNYDWTSGSVDETGVATHIAVIGDGFLPVEYHGDTMYSRAGDFSIVEDPAAAGSYVLMRPGGAMLLDINLDRITFDAIPTDMAITADGAMTVVGAAFTNGTGELGLQRFGNPDTLDRQEGGLFKTTPNTVLTTVTPETPSIGGVGYMIQGRLEQSNVDLVKEFTDMMTVQRAFQANARTVTTADAMMQEVLNLKR